MVRSVRIRHHNSVGHVGVLRIVSGVSLPAVGLVVVHFELDNHIVPFDHCEGELDKLVVVAAVVVGVVVVVVALGDEFDFDAILVVVPLDGPVVAEVDELPGLKREADGPLFAVCTYFELGARILVPGMTFDPFAVAYTNTVVPVSSAYHIVVDIVTAFHSIEYT